MITADPQRTPTLTMFALPDYFLFAGAANCILPCITVPTTPPTSTFAWNHGGIQPEIATTWLGMVGPGVRNNGDDGTWADHADVRPTMLDLVGLKDTYLHDGRVDRPTPCLGGAADVERASRDAAAARARLQADKRAVRRLRYAHPLRLDEGDRERDPGRRRHLHVAGGRISRRLLPSATRWRRRFAPRSTRPPPATPRSTSSRPRAGSARPRLCSTRRRRWRLLSRITSEGSSSRDSPGSSPSSVSPA